MEFSILSFNTSTSISGDLKFIKFPILFNVTVTM